MEGVLGGEENENIEGGVIVQEVEGEGKGGGSDNEKVK